MQRGYSGTRTHCNVFSALSFIVLENDRPEHFDRKSMHGYRMPMYGFMSQ